MGDFLVMIISIIVIISLISVPMAFYRRTRKKKYDTEHKKKDFFRCLIFAITSIITVIGFNIYLIRGIVINKPPFNITVIGVVMLDATFGIFILISNIICIRESILFLKNHK